jgi:hypothetical protein
MVLRLNKDYPKELTSYDLLKSLALITMIIDHMGYFLFPDESWMRLIGRVSFPLWLFLVGYANSRDLSAVLWMCAASVCVAGLVFGSGVLPVNILFSIIIVRLVLDYCAGLMFHSAAMLWVVPSLLIIMAVPTNIMFEYGALGIMVAMMGWMLRHRAEKPAVRRALPLFTAATILTHVMMTFLVFSFTALETKLMPLVFFATYGLMFLFGAKSYPVLTKKLPKLVVLALQFMGRYSLYIYVFHIVLFMFFALWRNPEKFQLFQWSWF